MIAALFGAIFSAFWGAPAGAQELGLAVQTGHQGPLEAMAVSGDGATLLTAGHDGLAQLWEIRKGRALRHWVAGTRQGREVAPLRGAALSRDGKLALTIDALGSIDLRASETGEAQHQWQIDGATRGIAGLAITPDGSAIVAATATEVCVWNARSFALKWQWSAEAQSAFSAFAQSADGNYLAVGNKRGHVRVFSLGDGREVATLDTRIGPATGLAFCGKENLLLLASGSPQVAVWKAAERQNIGELTFPSNTQTLSGNLGNLVSAFDDAGHLMFASLQTRATWLVSPGPEIVCASLISNATNATNATTFLAGRLDGTAEICDLYTGTSQLRFESALDPKAAARWFSRHVLGASGVPSDELPLGAGTQGVVDGLYAPSGRRFAGRTRDGRWYLWRRRDETQKWFPLIPQPVAAQETAAPDEAQPDAQQEDKTQSRTQNGTAKPTQVAKAPLNAKTKLAAALKPAVTQNQPVVFSADSSRLLLISGDEASVFETETGILQVSWNCSTADLTNPTTKAAGKAGDELMDVALSPDGRFAGVVTKDRSLRVWQVDGAAVPGAQVPGAASMQSFEAPSGYFTALTFTDAGGVVAGGSDGAIHAWDAQGKPDGKWQAVGAIEAVVWSSGAVFAATSEGEIWRFGMEGDQAERVSAHLSDITVGGIVGLELLTDKIHLMSCGADGALRFFDVADLAPRGAIYSLKRGGWLAVESDGKFDSSSGAAPGDLHFVRGLNSFSLAQVSLAQGGAQAFDANWVAARFGVAKSLTAPLLVAQGAPRLKFEIPKGADRTLQIEVTNQGGGIGPVSVAINGIEVKRDARGPRFDPASPNAKLSVELTGEALRPGRRNWIRVVASASTIAALPTESWESWDEPGAAQARKPRFWGIFVGVSRTRADENKVPVLKYAAADARALATALLPAARRQFPDPGSVQFRLFSSDPPDLGVQLPDMVVATASKDNLVETLRRLTREAYEEDTVLIFLAGHGVTYDPKGETYAFLTSEATSADLTDSLYRSRWALTGKELADSMLHMTAGNVAIILDTCAAGASTNLDEKAQTSAFDINNAFDINTVKRKSFFVLAGTAATAQSYEIETLKHGILTYALLEGLQGGALSPAIETVQGGVIEAAQGPIQNLDSLKWLTYAREQGDKIARRHKAPQNPILRNNITGDALLGQFATADIMAIEIAGELPFLRAPLFREDAENEDPLDLESKVSALLRNKREDAPFNFGDNLAIGSVEPRGIYTRQGDMVKVTLRFYDGKISREQREVKAPRIIEATITEIADAVAQAIAEAMKNGLDKGLQPKIGTEGVK